MAGRNAPGTPPLGAGRGRLFSRSAFMDGTNATLYGPRQRGWEDVDAVDYETNLLPGDWPAAGTPLRVPQVAWLSPNAPWRLYRFAYNDPAIYGDFDAEYAGGLANPRSLETFDATVYPTFKMQHRIFYQQSGEVRFDYTRPIQIELHDEAVPFYAPDGGEFLDEFYDGMAYFRSFMAATKGVMEAAKATVEALRPGRTWVEVCPWNFPGDLEALYAPTWWEGFLPMPLPPPDWAGFGTDFLHVYAGHVGFNAIEGVMESLRQEVDPESAHPDPAGRIHLFDFTPDVAPHPCDRPEWAAHLDRAAGHARTFARYHAVLLSYKSGLVEGVDFTAFPTSGGWSPPPSPGRLPNLGVAIFMPTPAYFADAMRDAGPTNAAVMGRMVDEFVAATAGVGSTMSAEFDPRIADDLTADDIVEMIAAHYHFDPATGRDLE